MPIANEPVTKILTCFKCLKEFSVTKPPGQELAPQCWPQTCDPCKRFKASGGKIRECYLCGKPFDRSEEGTGVKTCAECKAKRDGSPSRKLCLGCGNIVFASSQWCKACKSKAIVGTCEDCGQAVTWKGADRKPIARCKSCVNRSRYSGVKKKVSETLEEQNAKRAYALRNAVQKGIASEEVFDIACALNSLFVLVPKFSNIPEIDRVVIIDGYPRTVQVKSSTVDRWSLFKTRSKLRRVPDYYALVCCHSGDVWLVPGNVIEHRRAVARHMLVGHEFLISGVPKFQP